MVGHRPLLYRLCSIRHVSNSTRLRARTVSVRLSIICLLCQSNRRRILSCYGFFFAIFFSLFSLPMCRGADLFLLCVLPCPSSFYTYFSFNSYSARVFQLIPGISSFLNWVYVPSTIPYSFFTVCFYIFTTPVLTSTGAYIGALGSDVSGVVS